MLAATCVASAAATIALTRWERRDVAGFTKTLASLCFVAIGVLRYREGGLDGLVLAGLGLGVVGDVLLVFRARACFLAGLGAFLLGHVAYAAAFARRGLAPGPAVIAALAFVGVSVLLWRWASSGVRAKRMTIPVALYFATIGAMVTLATGAAFATGSPWLAIGSVLFAASDCAVARQHFVVESSANRTWGLPLYYSAQLVFALASGA